jgi:hypothetical protein
MAPGPVRRDAREVGIGSGRPTPPEGGHWVLPSAVAAWVREKGIRVLNVAGNREGQSPGIGDRAERFMTAVFRQFERAGG